MDAFVDSLVQLLIDWGYLGLFISALLAGSIVPFSSELVMIALVKVGLSPVMCVLFATLGNTIGGMTCYYMGRLGNVVWIEKYFKVKKEKVLLSASVKDFCIIYRRIKSVNELVVNGKVYDEKKAVIEFSHNLFASIDGHIVEAGVDSDSFISYIRFDGQTIAEKKRLL